MTTQNDAGYVFARSAFDRVTERLATYDDRRLQLAERFGRYGGDLGAMLSAIHAQHRWDLRERERLLAGGLADRPRRRMPPLQQIAAFHGLPDPPSCVRCGYAPPGPQTWREFGPSSWDLQRAHIIDRCYAGLDNVANLLPLCPLCHRSQPDFKPADIDVALRWFHGGPNEERDALLAAALDARWPIVGG